MAQIGCDQRRERRIGRQRGIGTARAFQVNATAGAFAGIGMGLNAVLTAILAPWIAPYPEAEVVGPKYLPWAGPHWLGTDALGRDVLSRLIYGARNTVGIALLTTVLGAGAMFTLYTYISPVLQHITDATPLFGALP